MNLLLDNHRTYTQSLSHVFHFTTDKRKEMFLLNFTSIINFNVMTSNLNFNKSVLLHGVDNNSVIFA